MGRYKISFGFSRKEQNFKKSYPSWGLDGVGGMWGGPQEEREREEGLIGKMRNILKKIIAVLLTFTFDQKHERGVASLKKI